MSDKKILLEDIPVNIQENKINRPKWSGFFKVVEPLSKTELQTDSQSIDGSSLYANSNWYQFVTYGSAARLNRYKEFDLMDGDCDITRALDIIAEEMCGNIGKDQLPFVLDMSNDSQMPKNAHYVVALTAALKRWCEIQSFRTRIFPTNRKTIKYGDCFYIKKNPTEKWIPLSPKQIIGAIVDKEDVTRVLGWQIQRNTMMARGSETIGNYQVVGSEQNDAEYEIVNADEIVRFSINTELADVAPFGESALQSVYRTFRQKQLLEDAILIYRLARAPERLVFKIDTRGMPAHRSHQFLEKVKNDMNQKMIPSPNASGGIESTYNPQCLVMDTLIPLMDGRLITLAQIAYEHNNGKQLWAYSVNPETGEVAPGLITWAGVTRKLSNTITLLFSNGHKLVCTPDHKIPTQNRGFVEAIDLTSDDLLFPFMIFKNKFLENGEMKNTSILDNCIKDVFKTKNSYINKFDIQDVESELTVTVTSTIINQIKEDTGTLTIDSKHIIHDFHTFAIGSGIFVKNSMMENFYFKTDENGNGSSVDVLSGGMNLGQLEDLEYFEDKVFRGLRVPLSYIKTKADNPAIFNDGKIGLAYIEETRFSQYIERLQCDQDKVYDHEFKQFVQAIGINIDPLYFSIALPPPTNFSTYREMELNAELLNAFSNADGVKSISKRYAMKKYLKWNEAEIAINEQWKRQELGLKNNDPTAFRKIYDETSENDSDIGGGSFRDLDSSFGGNELDMGGGDGMDLGDDGGQEESPNNINANDTGNLNAGSGDQLGSSNAEKK